MITQQEAQLFRSDGAGNIPVLSVKLKMNGEDGYNEVAVFRVTNDDGDTLFAVSQDGSVTIVQVVESLGGFAITNGPTWTAGIGAPSGSPSIGSLYSRLDAGVGDSALYVYEAAGWVGK